MGRHMILYRGSLKSCNYRCSYCPFSKHRMSERELLKDKEQWFSFLGTLEERMDALDIGALMVVPYGEALIHSFYWEGLARASAYAGMDAVGAQTNLSFSIPDALSFFQKAGGKKEKLRLWATFHPEMTTISEFAGKCRQLAEAGVALCAGAVGVPENLVMLRELRAKLPEDIYLWINKMDGLRRPYTKEETEAILGIDPYFLQEQMPVPADPSQCHGRLFVEGNGSLHTCNISKTLSLRWEELREDGSGLVRFPEPKCGRKLCSCYLAYGGRADFMNQNLFGPYPLFRIPGRLKADFLDMEGTLASTPKIGYTCHIDGKDDEHDIRRNKTGSP